MKKLALLMALVMIFTVVAGCSGGDVVLSDTAAASLTINEVMADNTNLCMGHANDWVEIYNAGDKPVALDAYYLTDDTTKLNSMPLKGYTVPAKGYVVINLPEEAPLHLSAKGETVYLTNGSKVLTQLAFPASSGGESFDSKGKCQFTTPGFANTEAGYQQYLATLKMPDLIINEVMSANSKYMSFNGKHYDLVEIKNNSDKPIDLAGYTLSDKRKEPNRYAFPAITLQPGEFYVVYCSGEANLGENHTTFKISATTAESVYLAKDGAIIDMIEVPADLVENESYGRNGNGFSYYSVPTFGAENGEGHNAGIASPKASIASGVYGESQLVELSGSGKIYYTTDGSRPTTSSRVYSSPIYVDGVMTIRTFCVDGNRKSQQTAFTYVCGETHSLPIVSVSIPQEYIDGAETGILNHIHQTIEKECQVTLIENGEEKFSLPCGFRLHGSGSREMPKQNFQLRFRSEYGASKLKYKLFENRDFDEYHSLLLKGGSEDYDKAVMRDEVATTALEGQTSLYVQDYKPVVLYLGGQYWGVYYLRERFSADYVASHLDVSKESVDLLETTFGYVQDGSASDFSKLKSYVSSHDMSLDENYDYLCSQIDAQSLMDWYICRSYMGDKDLANIRRFRSTEGDGKWRWMYFDLDWAFVLSKDNPLSGIVNDPNGEPILIRALLKNAKGRDAFLKRYAQLMGTVLNEQHMSATVDKIVAQVQDEMAKDRGRWGKSVSGWQSETERIKNYFKDGKRDQRVLENLKSYFNLSDEQMKAYFGDKYK